jgi:ribonuclease J
MLAVSVVLDERGRIVSGPQVRALGLPTESEDHLDEVLNDLADEAETALKRIKGDELEQDELIEKAISRGVKKASQRIWGRRPVVETTVLRV